MALAWTPWLAKGEMLVSEGGFVLGGMFHLIYWSLLNMFFSVLGSNNVILRKILGHGFSKIFLISYKPLLPCPRCQPSYKKVECTTLCVNKEWYFKSVVGMFMALKRSTELPNGQSWAGCCWQTWNNTLLLFIDIKQVGKCEGTFENKVK